MALKKYNVFGGIKPKIDKRLLDAASAQIANNCRLESGAIVPFKELLSVSTLPAAGRVSIFPYNDSWLSWATDVDVVRGPLAEDQYSRIYYTGDGAPKMRAIVSGVEVEYTLGIPKPSAAPTISVEDKTEITWTLEWHYFYEETDGTQNDRDADEITITEVTAGKTYTLSTIPSKQAASKSAKFILFFDAYSSTGALMGRCYPDISTYASSSDLHIDGASVSAKQSTSSGVVTMSLSFDASSTSDYTTDRSWVYTFVSAIGEEGPPSDASPIVTMDPTQQARVTCPDTGTSIPAGTSAITTKRIYRTVTSDAGTAYQYVGELNLSQTEFTDNLTDLDVGETIPSIGWVAPDESLSGLVSMPGGFLAAFKGKTVYFSEPNYPHAWPLAYGQSVDHDIVGLGVSGNTLVVMTKGPPYLMTMTTPDTVTISKIPADQGCVSKRGICSISGAIVYPSQDGIVVVQSGTAIVFSAGVFGKPQWSTYQPESMTAAVYDGMVFLCSPAISIVFPVIQEMNKVVTIDATPTAMYSDVENDALYMVVGDALYQWDAGESNLEETWKGREEMYARPYAPTIIRLTASSYPNVLRLYANDTEVFSRSITDNEAQRLPILRKEKFWSVRVDGNNTVTELLVGDAMGELG